MERHALGGARSGEATVGPLMFGAGVPIFLGYKVPEFPRQLPQKMSENVIIPVPLASEENGDKMVIREKES